MATCIKSENGVTIEEIEKACGPSSSSSKNNKFSIAGSSTVFPVSQIWPEIYQVGCEVEFAVEGGGSTDGAGRVCGNPERGTLVNIGAMSRQWKESEAKVSSTNGHVYNCLEPGDTDRSAIQIEVAIGLTMAVREGGTAWECIQLLGGLTIDQFGGSIRTTKWLCRSYGKLYGNDGSRDSVIPKGYIFPIVPGVVSSRSAVIILAAPGWECTLENYTSEITFPRNQVLTTTMAS